MTRTSFTVSDLSAGYADRLILNGIDLEIPVGAVTAIVGANACGKSTLLRTMARLLAPRKGTVRLDDVPIHTMPPKRLARRLGLLPQSPIVPEGITVLDLVSRGRHPHQGMFGFWTGKDDAAVAEALAATRIAELAERPVDELSGGQRQRVWVAMALAQNTQILLLDEPTTYLDVTHQIEVLDLLTDLNRARGTTIVMVLHELNLATRYADYLVAMVAGEIRVHGAPRDVLTEANVREIFNLDSRVVTDPVSGKPMILPVGRHHCAHERDAAASSTA
ncbi:ABC transporter ATP-binding protein [Fulvimarina sp. 2208YS6-2-32]|uniref:ABC transporter ATP-binding protein n=1 Tax=Fulvimarina uroteuthidis TaxID=3098149 RepID=A0ABU5I295_9HYPH|nr:ABC transporter ATP-binding protein [Fulvimarina sp. 2208YS6-2-32]MDY8108893.1 ABC transporter ATP-binding protein [Fulvimarina sp. 2208YS6-2-32]